MKIIDEYECRIPDWAVMPLEYGDYSACTSEDEREVREWIRSIEREGAVYNIVFTNETDAFDPCPEFGLPCATIRARVIYYADERR